MNSNKIVPSLWLSADGGSLSKVIDYYKTIFGDNFSHEKITTIGNTPGGKTEICEVTIFEQKYVLMSTAKEHHPLNDAVSFRINCKDQKEIDTYWNYFTAEGKESQCGWCIDKYGIRWQVLPGNMHELLSKPNAFNVMIQQQKIVIEDYLK